MTWWLWDGWPQGKDSKALPPSQEEAKKRLVAVREYDPSFGPLPVGLLRIGLDLNMHHNDASHGLVRNIHHSRSQIHLCYSSYTLSKRSPQGGLVLRQSARVYSILSSSHFPRMYTTSYFDI
jgi:hypothetical protein